MGTYINPGNDGFTRVADDGYIDKTGLIALVNAAINTSRNLVCVTRPRRFGKTFAAESLVSYYSCGCDSRSLFEGLEISHDASFDEHLNAYNLVHLDMTAFQGAQSLVKEVTSDLLGELREMLPTAGVRDAGRHGELTSALADVASVTGRRFVFVIDEWDAPLRERETKASQDEWVLFLRRLFKNATFTPKVVAACYMTGILPIVRYGTQSALSDFREYTFLAPDAFAPYVGLTETEVERMAEESHMDIGELRYWYDGYGLPYFEQATQRQTRLRCYAPFSVRCACDNHRVGPYWTSSEAFRSLLFYVDMDFDGLQQTIVQALGGASVPVSTRMFANDLHDIASADDVLTLLCHLGYLAYDAVSGMARVPNEEVRGELREAVSQSSHKEVARIVRESEALLRAIWDMEDEYVSLSLSHAHDSGCAPMFYNDEQALRATVRSALISAADHYATVEELPSGRGLADVVYLPKRDDASPALVVELKWNRTPDSAIAQIRDRDYPQVLRDWEGPVLLVGVTYDPKTKEHGCTIERM